MPHCCVKGQPDTTESQVFGLSQADIRTVQNLLAIWGHRIGQDGLQIALPALRVVNKLCKHLGYSVVGTAQGTHASVVYTLHRPLNRSSYNNRY